MIFLMIAMGIILFTVGGLVGRGTAPKQIGTPNAIPALPVSRKCYCNHPSVVHRSSGTGKCDWHNKEHTESCQCQFFALPEGTEADDPEIIEAERQRKLAAIRLETLQLKEKEAGIYGLDD